jgi:hypothetical protein
LFATSQLFVGMYAADLFGADSLGYTEQFVPMTAGVLYDPNYHLASEGSTWVQLPGQG